MRPRRGRRDLSSLPVRPAARALREKRLEACFFRSLLLALSTFLTRPEAEYECAAVMLPGQDENWALPECLCFLRKLFCLFTTAQTREEDMVVGRGREEGREKGTDEE